MKLPAFCLASLVLLFALNLHAQTPQPEEAAQAATVTWLALLDGGKFDETWTSAAGAVQKVVPQDKWTKAMAAVTTSMGKVQSRTLKSAKLTHTMPGAPDGDYVILQYDTVYEKKAAAVETITPMKEADGTWKVSGYYVK